MSRYKFNKVLTNFDEVLLPLCIFSLIIGFISYDKLLLGVSVLILNQSKWSIRFNGVYSEVFAICLSLILGYFAKVTLICLIFLGLMCMIKIYLKKNLNKLVLLAPSILALGQNSKKILLATLIFNLIWIVKNKYELNQIKP